MSAPDDFRRAPLPVDLDRLLHDLRGPLNAVVIHLEVLKRLAGDQAPVRASLQSINQELERLTAMLPLAFAVSALEIYEQVYTARKVDTTTLRTLTPRLRAAGSDAERAKALNDEFGAVAPKFVQLTNNVVFDDLWRRSDLSMRDRSLVTIAALAAMGDDDQLDFYLRRGVESGLTAAQIAEALTHLGFYAGWPKATKAMTAVVRTIGK